MLVAINKDDPNGMRMPILLKNEKLSEYDENGKIIKNYTITGDITRKKIDNNSNKEIIEYLYIGQVEDEDGNKYFLKIVPDDIEAIERYKIKFNKESEYIFYNPFIERVYKQVELKYSKEFNAENKEFYYIGVLAEYVSDMNANDYFRELHDALEKEEIDEDTYATIVIKATYQLLMGMNYIVKFTKGKEGIFLHRDLKPKNIMVKNGRIIKLSNDKWTINTDIKNYPEVIKIIDFDSSHLPDSSNTRLSIEMKAEGVFYDVEWSDGYADVEETTEGYNFDEKSEIYSIGRTIFYMMNGKNYFYKGENMYSYGVEDLRYDEMYLTDKSEKKKSVYRSMISIVSKCCCGKDERYTKIEEVLEDFIKNVIDVYFDSKEEIHNIIYDLGAGLLPSDMNKDCNHTINIKWGSKNIENISIDEDIVIELKDEKKRVIALAYNRLKEVHVVLVGDTVGRDCETGNYLDKEFILSPERRYILENKGNKFKLWSL